MPVDCQMCCFLSLSLFLSTYDGPKKGFPPDSWKNEKAIFKLEGRGKYEPSGGCS